MAKSTATRLSTDISMAPLTLRAMSLVVDTVHGQEPFSSLGMVNDWRMLTLESVSTFSRLWAPLDLVPCMST